MKIFFSTVFLFVCFGVVWVLKVTTVKNCHMTCNVWVAKQKCRYQDSLYERQVGNHIDLIFLCHSI